MALRDIRIDSVELVEDDELIADFRSACPWLEDFTGGGVALRAFHRDTSVGVCAWREDEFVASFGPIYVRPDRRRFGVGGTLLDVALSWMRKRGIRQIDARFATGDSAAERLFVSRGFRSLGEERDPTSAVTWVEKTIKS